MEREAFPPEPFLLITLPFIREKRAIMTPSAVLTCGVSDSPTSVMVFPVRVRRTGDDGGKEVKEERGNGLLLLRVVSSSSLSVISSIAARYGSLHSLSVVRRLVRGFEFDFEFKRLSRCVVDVGDESPVLTLTTGVFGFAQLKVIDCCDIDSSRGRSCCLSGSQCRNELYI